MAGVRPFRYGSCRLEAESISGKFVVHNYGHGGAGITLSWGRASKVHDIVQGYLANSPDTDAAVIGAGVMGLTAATLLLDLGLTVTIYADRMPAGTTSIRAGGQWAASEVTYDGKKQELGEILQAAYGKFKQSIDSGNIYEVYERPNYTPERASNLDIVPQLAPGLIPSRFSSRGSHSTGTPAADLNTGRF